MTPCNPPGAERERDARELGAFLRRRRESLDPAVLGMARCGRRRTPGLRREDVAALADIGITWYTKLEQGRPIRVSARVLTAVAHALQCSDSETRLLFHLAGLPPPDDAGTHRPCARLGEATQRILDQLDPLPALIQNARYDILGFNRAYSRMVNVDLGAIAPEDRNCVYLSLTHPGWRASLAEWDDLVPRMAAQLRNQMADHRHEPDWQRMIERFRAVSPEFDAAWQRYEVRAVENQIKRFRHPAIGEYRLLQNNWWSGNPYGSRLLVYAPVDPQGEEALRRLAQREEAAAR